MKQRKQRNPLRKGDLIKFVGWSDERFSCRNDSGILSFVPVSKDWNSALEFVETCLGKIERNQIIAVKRKKQRREFIVRICPTNIEHVWVDQITYVRTNELCKNCEVIKVREVKE